MLENNSEQLSSDYSFDFKVEFFDMLDAAVKTLIVALFIFTFVFSFSTVKETSMLPTLFDGDKVVVRQFMYKPKFQDVVVVTQPNFMNHRLVKRVIATGGQTIDIDPVSHKVLIDGKEIDEPYIYEPTIVRGDIEYPVTVPEGKLFVMGDNRNGSYDSRRMGFVDERYISGKVCFRLWPKNRIGAIK